MSHRIVAEKHEASFRKDKAESRIPQVSCGCFGLDKAGRKRLDAGLAGRMHPKRLVYGLTA